MSTITAAPDAPGHVKTVPVIVITGRDLDVKDIATLKMHGIPYLRKGRVDMHEIHQTIRNVVLNTDS